MSYYSLVDDDLIDDDECGAAALGSHFHNNCVTTKNTEAGRTRSSGWITKSYLPTVLEDPTNQGVWEAGILSGDIIIVPISNGTYDPGTPEQTEGFGDQAFSQGPRTQVLTFIDPVYFKNAAFYKTISAQSDRVPLYRTESILHIADVPATIVPSPPVQNDLKSRVNWSVANTWISEELPTLVDLSTTTLLSTVFDAKYLNQLKDGYPAFTTQPADQDVAAGASFTFTAVVTGTPAPDKQWQKSTDSGLTWVDITGATNASYTKTGAADADEIKYRLKASNSKGVRYSSVVTVAVTAPVVYANVVAFDTSTTGVATSGDKQQMTFIVTATNANQKIKFPNISNAGTGGPLQINIKENGVTKASIGGYGQLVSSGLSFEYDDTAGNPHTQPFAAEINITV